ncbi:MAG: hypothetical protein EZS28_027610 [Streblomastix strix]|uniref:Uncharacterized protein n=1 Tax=Streblomastix strix TaxID=222440 RepID=A0A5J4V2Y4_9EUKA|nr:MAG: hypothetical protein EZS28_027610 [Streblomastix strix]
MYHILQIMQADLIFVAIALLIVVAIVVYFTMASVLVILIVNIVVIIVVIALVIIAVIVIRRVEGSQWGYNCVRFCHISTIQLFIGWERMLVRGGKQVSSHYLQDVIHNPPCGWIMSQSFRQCELKSPRLIKKPLLVQEKECMVLYILLDYV